MGSFTWAHEMDWPLIGTVFDEPTLLGLAAVLTSVSGAVTTIVGVRRSRKEAKDKADEQCRERLRNTRAEAENLADALHHLRMSRYNHPRANAEEQLREVDDILERWSHLEPE